MLKRLQRNFIALTVTLLALVLFGTLALTYGSSQRQLDTFIQSSLDRVLKTDTPTRPYIGVMSAPALEENTTFGQLAVFWVDINDQTQQISENSSQAIIGPQALDAVLQEWKTREQTSGYIQAFNIVWKTAEVPGATRIAIASTLGIGSALQNQLFFNMAIGVVVIVILFFVMLGISRWIITPVKQSFDMQRQFSQDVSHELKTPIAVIRANHELLRRSSTTLSAEDKKLLEINDSEAQSMQALVEALLEIAQAEEVGRNTTSIARTNVNVSEVAQDCILNFEVLAFEQGHTLQASLAENVFSYTNRFALERVMGILIDNAIKYSAPIKPIEIGLRQNGHKLTFFVTNYGEVLTHEQIVHIFDRFYRSDFARSKETGGFGLGLAIAHAIIVSLGGTISCSSSKEEGTRFSFTLESA